MLITVFLVEILKKITNRLLSRTKRVNYIWCTKCFVISRLILQLNLRLSFYTYMTSHDADEADSQKTIYFLERDSQQVNNVDTQLAFTGVNVETVPCSDKQILFPRLLGGSEPEEAARQRWKLYERSQQTQESRISELFAASHEQLLSKVTQFVASPWVANEETRLDTCILMPGANIAEHIRLFQQIRTRLAASGPNRWFVASIASKECPNLKTALKLIVMRLTEQQNSTDTPPDTEDNADIDDDEEDEESELRYDKRLRYDFDILLEWCKRHSRQRNMALDQLRIVICIEDSDSFHVNVLSDLIKYLRSYISHIPLKLVFSVATSLAVFQDKLLKSCIRHIRGTALNAQIENGTSQVLLNVMFDPQLDGSHFIGPHLLSMLQQRQQSSVQSIDSFIASLRYVKMSHFYGNPFSIFLYCNTEDEYKKKCLPFLTAHHLSAIRMLPSFSELIQRLAEQNTKESKERARALLLDDAYLNKSIWPALLQAKNYLQSVMEYCVAVYNMEQALLPREDQHTLTDIYCSSLLHQPPPSELLGGLEHVSKTEPERYGRALLQVLERVSGITSSELLSKFTTLASEYSNQLLLECFLPDNESLMANVFVPTYRAAIELGLCDPTHYWGGEIRKDSDAPHLSIMYQLYRESSLYINSYDYYIAFRNCLEAPPGINEDVWAKKTLAWFLHGVSELKFLGILRDCKRKFECVEKIAWKGL